MLVSIITGLIVGFVQVGSTMWRTIQVIRGEVLKTLLGSIIISIGYFISINMLVDNDIVGYISFSVGAALATMYIAYTNKKHGEKTKH